MSKYLTDKKVKQCFHSCPFFKVGSDGMECGHPYFDDKGVYDNMIITQYNSKNRVPDECPLRNSKESSTEVVLRVSLENKNK